MNTETRKTAADSVNSSDRLCLFVWEDVLKDYTAGMACAIAHNEDEAWKALAEADHTAWWFLRGRPEDRNDPRTADKLKDDPTVVKPRRVDSPEGFAVWGGG